MVYINRYGIDSLNFRCTYYVSEHLSFLTFVTSKTTAKWFGLTLRDTFRLMVDLTRYSCPVFNAINFLEKYQLLPSISSLPLKIFKSLAKMQIQLSKFDWNSISILWFYFCLIEFFKFQINSIQVFCFKKFPFSMQLTK